MDSETLKTVIGIVPEFEIYDSSGLLRIAHPYLTPHQCYPALDNCPQFALDMLAAAAVRVLEDKDKHTSVVNARWQDGQYRPYCNISFLPSPISSIHAHLKVEGEDRTANTLNAIAEFVNKGGFESE